jgi:hypothetical protein
MKMRRTPLDPGEAFADGLALLVDDPWVRGGTVFTVNVHDGSTHPGKARVRGSEAHWVFEIDPAPSFPPPSQLAARSRESGGKVGAMRTLSDQWPGSKALTMRISASYVVDGKRYRLDPQIDEARPKKVTCRSGSVVAARGAILDVEGVSPGLLTVEYPKDSEPFSLTWSGRAKVTLDPDLAEMIDGAIWQTLSQFLVPKNERKGADTTSKGVARKAARRVREPTRGKR